MVKPWSLFIAAIWDLPAGGPGGDVSEVEMATGAIM
jgi:hypothetical protein